jgi:peptidoglycan/LPS O-acetylase OafA/YrhL
VSPDTLDVPVINTIFFVLGVALLLAAQGSRGLVRGALNGLALAMGLCILLYSFCAGANWLTFIWLLFAMLCVGALLGVQMNDDDDAARS